MLKNLALNMIDILWYVVRTCIYQGIVGKKMSCIFAFINKFCLEKANLLVEFPIENKQSP